MIFVTVMTALAGTLLGERVANTGPGDDFTPPLGKLLEEGSHAALEPSGLPLRAR